MRLYRPLLSILIHLSSVTAFAAPKPELAFDSAKFVCRAVQLIHEQLGPDAKARFEKAANTFDTLSIEKLGPVPPQTSPLELASYYSTAFQAHHSLPLLDGKPILDSNSINWNGLLYLEINRASRSKPTENLVYDKDLLVRLKRLNVYKGVDLYEEKESVRIKQMNLYRSRSQTIVKWLIEQDPYSVSPLELLEKATELTGGDTLTALGILGQLFDSERHGPTQPRSHMAVLGSRVRPYFTDGRKHIGANYHFWVYLNMTLARPTVWAHWFSRLYERYFQGDRYEDLVDQAGINSGNAIRHLLLNDGARAASCGRPL